MRIGLVTKWYASGQAVVSRQLRSALDQLGHSTFVLVRPGKGPREQVDRGDPVWDQPGLTHASTAEVPTAEYEHWAEANGLDAALCDNNYQFSEIGRLRARGVRTIGRFVWEHFAPEHVAGAREAYDVVYSFTRAEQERYAELGIDSPYVPWGCHPELLAIAGSAGRTDVVRFYVPGSFMGKRKPFAEIVEAFERVADPRLRLLVRGQVERKRDPLGGAADRDERIQLELSDRPTDDHLRQFAACDVCLSPSRWEGLGLPLYEAIAFGMPAITNDAPPMNEAVVDGVNGVCVRSVPWGTARSGIPAYDPDTDELAAAIERLADDEERARLAAGARQLRDGERAWARTVERLGDLVASVA
ncbi:MAG TPA: glycosyltransferase family 4 protein [Solirubrobacterales bacterium]|nr:glycosyltransferase family 4 protein [Solirubrobacterales bacterium]